MKIRGAKILENVNILSAVKETRSTGTTLWSYRPVVQIHLLTSNSAASITAVVERTVGPLC